MTYHEEITFFSGAYFFILGFVAVIALWMDVHAGSAIIPLFFVGLLIPLLFGRFVIRVSNNSLRVSFGYLGVFDTEIPLSDIQEARVVEYRPIRQFGGWGIRCGKFEGEKTGCYSMKGARGVLLLLSNEVRVCLRRTGRIIIGSSTPERLKASIGK